MPKTKLPPVDRTPETLEALKQFKEGDRVYNRLTKKHGFYQAPNYKNAMPDCWVRYEEIRADELFVSEAGISTDPLNLELCHCSQPDTTLQEQAVILQAQLPPDTNLCGQSNLINTPPVSIETDSLIPSLSKETSENLQTSLLPGFQESTFLSSEVLVRTFPLLETEPELVAITQACFLKDSDYCDYSSLKHFCLKMCRDSSAVETETTSPLSLAPSLNWGMWGLGKSATDYRTSPKTAIESSLWVLTGNVQCKKINSARATLAECLDTAGIILDRHISGDRIYKTICPTIRSPKGGSNLKVILPDGTRRNVSGDELERLMGWDSLSTKTGITPDGEVVSISEIQRHKMLGNGIIPAEIEDICNSLRPFLEKAKNHESAIADNSLVKVNNKSAIADLQIMGEKEAHFIIQEINNACNTIRSLLVDLDERQGYIALGFTSMSRLLKSNLFSKAKSTLHLELVAGKIEKENLLVEVGTFPESQLRSLNKIKGDYHGEAMSKAKEVAGDRPLTAKDVSASVASMVLERPETRVRSIVDTIKEKTFVPLTECAQYAVRDVVIVKAHGNSTLRPYDGYWGIIERISDYFYHLCISLKEEKISSDSRDVSLLLGCKGDEVERVELNESDKLLFKSVSDRIKALARLMELDDIDRAQLEVMQRRTIWTERQKQALTYLEQLYEPH